MINFHNDINPHDKKHCPLTEEELVCDFFVSENHQVHENVWQN